MSTDYRALCAELIEDVCYLIDCVDHDCCDPVALMECREHLWQTRAALAQPEPEGPSVETMAQIVYENAMLATAPEHARPHWPSWSDLPNSDARIHSLNTAEIILARWGRPTTKPVPVAERLPGPEDCDSRGWCWYWHPGEECWEMVPVVTGTLDEWTHWIPHHALPLPTPTP
jgi:hypothetical protein